MSENIIDNQTTVKSGKLLNYGLWAVQLLLALAFGLAGVMKTGTPIAELSQQMPWAGAIPEYLVRFIGICEFSAALGFILPSVTRIKPILTPWAGIGIIAIMVLASIFHITRGEFQALPTNFILGALAAFVAYGRFKLAPIESNSPKGAPVSGNTEK